MKGRVKWFSAEKGWGFISVDGQRDVFVHHTAIEAPGYRSLREGEEVEFELVQGERGPYAAKVVKQAESG